MKLLKCFIVCFACAILTFNRYEYSLCGGIYIYILSIRAHVFELGTTTIDCRLLTRVYTIYRGFEVAWPLDLRMRIVYHACFWFCSVQYITMSLYSPCRLVTLYGEYGGFEVAWSLISCTRELQINNFVFYSPS